MTFDIESEYDKVFKFCYFKVHDKNLAQDLTQETFLIYFKQKDYINRGKLLAYLYTIAKNLCYDHYKSKKTYPLDDNDVIEDKTINVLTNIALQDAINNLPSDLKEIIILRFTCELAINEIATFLNISRFAVYRLIKNATKMLNKDLKMEDFYE